MTWDAIWPLLLAAVGVGLGVLVVEILYRICRGLVRLVWRRTRQTRPAERIREQWEKRGRFSDSLLDRVYRPVQVLAAAGGALIALALPGTDQQDSFGDSLLLAMAITGGWLVTVVVLWLVAATTSFFRFGGSDAARRFRSQVETLSRALGLVAFVGIVVALVVSIEQAHSLGATFLASTAGIGAIFGLAATTALANVFAGITIGFSGRANIGDVVEVGGETGEVTERTLTHVVLKLSNQRHLVIPSASFLGQAHTNWRITKNLVVGWVPLEVGWHVPLDTLTNELKQVHDSLKGQLTVGASDQLRVEVVGVSDSAVRVRAKVIAIPDDLWDVQCAVREHLIRYLNEHHEDSLPYTRVTVLDPATVGTGTPSPGGSGGGRRSGTSHAPRQRQLTDSSDDSYDADSESEVDSD